METPTERIVDVDLQDRIDIDTTVFLTESGQFVLPWRGSKRVFHTDYPSHLIYRKDLYAFYSGTNFPIKQVEPCEMESATPSVRYSLSAQYTRPWDCVDSTCHRPMDHLDVHITISGIGVTNLVRDSLIVIGTLFTVGFETGPIGRHRRPYRTDRVTR